MKIAESPSKDANEDELPGIGGAINFICKELNDIYAGKELQMSGVKRLQKKLMIASRIIFQFSGISGTW